MTQAQEFQEVTETLEVPRHSGIEGFLIAIRGVLKLPRVVNLSIDARGKISYTRYARPEEPRKQVDIDFESVMPSQVIRAGSVQEVTLDGVKPEAFIPVLFARAAADRVFPIAFVAGADSWFFRFHETTIGVKLTTDSAYGLPIYRDRHIPDEAFVLVCSYGPDGALVDAQVSYKMTIPEVTRE